MPSDSTDAAERLRQAIREHKEPETDAELILLDEALAAERRATVERFGPFVVTVLALIEEWDKELEPEVGQRFYDLIDSLRLRIDDLDNPPILDAEADARQDRESEQKLAEGWNGE